MVRFPHWPIPSEKRGVPRSAYPVFFFSCRQTPVFEEAPTNTRVAHQSTVDLQLDDSFALSLPAPCCSVTPGHFHTRLTSDNNSYTTLGRCGLHTVHAANSTTMEQQRVRRTFALLALVAFARCGSADLSVVADANVTGTPAPTSAPDVTTAHAVNEPAPKTTAASVSINNTSFLYDAYGGTGAWRWRSEKQRGSPCLDGSSRRVGATVRGNEIVRYYLEGVFFFHHSSKPGLFWT